jgi:predicted PurR-regulated permease PerM
MADPPPQESSRASQNTENAPARPDLLATTDESEILHASIKAGSVAQIVVAVIAVIGLIYLKLVMVTALTSILLAFVSEPLVSRLVRIGIPRAAGALLAVVLLVGLVGGLADLRAQTNKIEESTRSVITSPTSGKPRWRLRFNRLPAYRT